MTPAAPPSFEDQVFPIELAEVARRREALGLRVPDPAKGPSTDHDLVGLALSGGGIRCASLSLGVLQALSGSRVLRSVDYLSTVSGGGLIGSAVSSVMNSPDVSAEPERFPLGFEGGISERPAVRYIRDNCRYLSPGGLLDAIRLPAVVLRGMISNLALLLPWLLIAVLLTEGLYALAFEWGPDRVERLPRWIAAGFVAFALLLPVFYRLAPERFTWKVRNRLELVLASALVVGFVVVLLVRGGTLVQDAIDVNWAAVHAYAGQHELEAWLAAGAVIGLLVLAGTAAQSPSKIKNLIGLAVLGLIGPSIVFGLYLTLTLYEMSSPRLDRAPTQALAAERSERLQRDLNSGILTDELKKAFADAECPLVGNEIVSPPRSRGQGRSAFTSWLVETPGHTYHWWCSVWDCDTDYLITLWRGDLRLINAVMWGYDDLALVLMAILGLLYGFFFCDQNVTSQHGFFRDRLSRTFVFSLTPRGAIEPADALKLSELNRSGSTAPYHLVNAALNLQGAKHLDLAGRKADFLIFSRHFVGSPTTGYCRTTAIEEYDRNLNLGTAMSVSGAGLAPNAGTQTIGPLVFLTSLLNLRLDYWLPNPAIVREGRRRFRMRGGVGPVYLWKEALGRLDADGPFVNVSDGGHLENLGLCELLRRRCRRIIVVDGTEDPAMTFSCLVAAIRYARIDLGIQIAIDLDGLRLRDGLSTRHWALGFIDYGRGEHGELIYLKSSLTGDESEAILEYRRVSAAFPQDPSSNQFFSESQLEAYRALGEHIAAAMLQSGEVAWPGPAGVQAPHPRDAALA